MLKNILGRIMGIIGELLYLDRLRGETDPACENITPAKKYSVGLTFGAYCPLHAGHINLFLNAKKYCQKLVVCVSDDDYVEKNKGYRPFFNIFDRIKHLKEIRTIDIVDVQTMKFGKKEAIIKYKPDVLFVGNDWSPTTYKGEGLGVPVIYLPHTGGISSTLLRKK